MTAIHLPPGSPSGQHLDTSALRAQVSANKLAALMPSASPNGATISQSEGTATQGADVSLRPSPQGQLPAPQPGGSTRESLSFAARTILSLLGQGESGPLRGASPLLAMPPTRLPNAAAQTQQALVHLVQDSGLFYESHLAQWIAGQRGLASMAREPQAGIGRAPYPNAGHSAGSAPPPQPGANGAPPGGTGAYGGLPGSGARPSFAGPMPGMTPAPAGAMADLDAIIDVVSTPLPLTATSAEPEAATQPGANRAQPDADGNDAQPAPRDAATRGSEPPRSADLPRVQQAGAQLYQAAANEAARNATSQSMFAAAADLDTAARPEAAMSRADTAPAVHPNTEAIVRQQLELLATHQFRWAGEAWPGTPMQWEVSDQLPEHGRQTGGDAGDGEARTWSSRLLLELPQLGAVEARLTLTPSGLETRLTVQEDRIALMLSNAQERLRTSLDARGIDLLHFSIQRDGAGRGPGSGA